MTNKEQLETIFKKYDIPWNIREFKEYINPKPKSVTSILGKMQRLYVKSGCPSVFTFESSGINDLLRITIIADYKDVVSLLKRIKETFKDATGHFKIKNSGYCGIHVHFSLEGVPCEIQLAPEMLVMAVDYLHLFYEKWRDFQEEEISTSLEEQQKLVLNCASKDEQEVLYRHWKEQEELFKEKLKEKEQDVEFRRSVYQEVYAFLQYDQYEEEIAFALEEMNKVKGKSSVLQDRDLLPLFCTNLVTNGNLDLEKVREISEKLLPLLEPRQKKLIALVKENNILVTENVKN